MSYFSLYSNCIPVKGHTRTAICDLQNHEIHFIPNALFLILQDIKDIARADLSKQFDSESFDNLILYLDHLVENDLGFWSETPELFPEMDLEWDYPSTISNAILEIDNLSLDLAEEIFTQLDQLACSAIELRAYRFVSFTKIKQLLAYTHSLGIKSIELYLKAEAEIPEAAWREEMRQNPRLRSVVLHSSTERKVLELLPNYYLTFTDKKMTDHSHCGLIKPAFFSVNIETFTEGQEFNTCLNRKLSIDGQGNVRNCPSLPRIYGNVKTKALKEIIEEPTFKELWTISKSQILKCKDCEFRAVCTDCRAYIEDEDNIYSKPLKCNYDPYTGEWT